MKNINQNTNEKFAKEFIAKYPKFSSVKYSKENLDNLMKLIKIEISNKLNELSARLELRDYIDLDLVRKDFKNQKMELALVPFEIYESSITINGKLVSALGKIEYYTDCYKIQLNKVYFEKPDDINYALSLIDVLAHEIVHGFVYSRFKDTKRYLKPASATHANDGHMFFEKCLELTGISSTRTNEVLDVYHVFQCEDKSCTNRMTYLRKSTKLANRYICPSHKKPFAYVGKHSGTTLNKADAYKTRL